MLASQIAIAHPPTPAMSDEEVSDFLDAAITSFAAKKKKAAADA